MAGPVGEQGGKKKHVSSTNYDMFIGKLAAAKVHDVDDDDVDTIENKKALLLVARLS